MASVLYPLLRERPAVPAAVKEALGEAYYRRAAQSARLLHEREAVVGALGRDGVAVLLLKGAALAETAYRDAGPRRMVDLDLLVPRAQVGAAEAALAGLGYAMVTADPWPGFSWRYRNCAAYRRDGGGGFPLYVGLHIHLFDVPLYERIPVGEWFGRAQPLPGAGPAGRMPAAEDHLVYLCGHGALHHGQEPDLLRLLDLALLIRWAGGALDWGGVVARAADWRLVVPVQAALGRLEELWPGSVPPGAAAEAGRLEAGAAERRVQGWLARRGRSPAADTLLALATMPGLARRARYLAEVALPSPAYMRRRYCPERPGLWPLAYLGRAGRAAGGLFRRRR